MATTFAPFLKNALLNFLTGVSSSGTTHQIYYANFYNGAMPGDPTVTPAGTAVFANPANGPILNGKWTSADNNATAFLSVSSIAPYLPAGAGAVSSLTFARLLNNSPSAAIDTPIATSAGAGVGAVVDTLNSSSGVGVSLVSTSIKMPRNNGSTLWLSLSLAKRIVDLITGIVSPSAANVPQMGINTNGACTITAYSGTVPADADAPITSQVALCTFTIGGTNLWATASAGSSAMAGTLTSAAAANTGTVSFCRMVKTNGVMTYTIQGSMGAAGTDFVIGTTSITAGNTYTLTDAVITL